MPRFAEPVPAAAVALTNHAVQRFIERCRPALDEPAAAAELMRLVAEHGHVVRRPPAWLAARAKTKSNAYLIVTEEMVLPLRFGRGRSGLIASTCLTKTGISDAARAARNGRAKGKREYAQRIRSERRAGGARPKRRR